MIIRHAKMEDIPQIIEVIRQSFEDAFGEINVQDAIDTANTFEYYYNFPEYSYNDIIVAENDGKIVSFAGAIPFPIKYKGLELKAAQLNPVATLQEYRKKGIAGKCIKYLCDYLKNQGYSIFFVCGHPNYYTRFGFNQVFNSFHGKISVNQLENIESDIEILNLRDKEVYNLLDIYEKAENNNLLHVKRDGKWIEKKIISKDQSFVPFCTISEENLYFSVKEGVYGGYAYINETDDKIMVQEIKAINREHAIGILKGLSELAKEKEMNEIEIENVIPDEIFYNIILDFYGEVKAFKMAPFMLKILSVKNLFASMKEIFKYRIENSRFNNRPFDFAIKTEDEKVYFEYKDELSINSEGYSDNTISISKEELTSLFNGYKSIYDLIEEGKCNDYGEEVNKIINTFFPKHYSYISELDTI